MQRDGVEGRLDQDLTHFVILPMYSHAKMSVVPVVVIRALT